ncbi:MAG: hypothetical protein K6U11_05395 [bacterium]|nr:hypothetical protein [bacterium]
MEDEKKVLEREIEHLNEEIKALGYQLSGLLHVDCSFGVCSFNPETDNVQEKLREVQEKKALLDRLKQNINSCLRK